MGHIKLIQVVSCVNVGDISQPAFTVVYEWMMAILYNNIRTYINVYVL